MGADQSQPKPEQPLYPQPTPICATEPRFCLPYNVKLHLKEKYSSMSGGDFKIMDADDNDIIYLRCEGRAFSLSSRKILRDNYGVPVLEHWSNKVKIFADEGKERQICTFESSWNMKGAKISTVFPDILNGFIERHLMLTCGLSSKFSMICLGDPKQGGVPLAQIFRPRLRHFGNDFIIEIAANVDIAICVMMCIDLVARR